MEWRAVLTVLTLTLWCFFPLVANYNYRERPGRHKQKSNSTDELIVNHQIPFDFGLQDLAETARCKMGDSRIIDRVETLLGTEPATGAAGIGSCISSCVDNMCNDCKLNSRYSRLADIVVVSEQKLFSYGVDTDNALLSSTNSEVNRLIERKQMSIGNIEHVLLKFLMKVFQTDDSDAFAGDVIRAYPSDVKGIGVTDSELKNADNCFQDFIADDQIDSWSDRRTADTLSVADSDVNCRVTTSNDGNRGVMYQEVANNQTNVEENCPHGETMSGETKKRCLSDEEAVANDVDGVGDSDGDGFVMTRSWNDDDVFIHHVLDDSAAEAAKRSKGCEYDTSNVTTDLHATKIVCPPSDGVIDVANIVTKLAISAVSRDGTLLVTNHVTTAGDDGDDICLLESNDVVNDNCDKHVVTLESAVAAKAVLGTDSNLSDVVADDDGDEDRLSELNDVDDDIRNDHVLILVAGTAMPLEDCLTTNANTANVTKTVETNLLVKAGKALMLRDMNRGLSLTLRININATESSTNVRWACEPKGALACMAPGPKVTQDENEKAPDLDLGVMSTTDGAGHIEPVVTAMHETCWVDGYAGNSETEYDGIDQVTDLEPTWFTMVTHGFEATCLW